MLCDSRQVPSVKFISQFSTTEKKLMKNLSEQINRTNGYSLYFDYLGLG